MLLHVVSSYYILYTSISLLFFFFNDTATTEIYTLSLHDALPICSSGSHSSVAGCPTRPHSHPTGGSGGCCRATLSVRRTSRSEEHTSELQSRQYLVCRLLLEKKKQTKKKTSHMRLII